MVGRLHVPRLYRGQGGQFQAQAAQQIPLVVVQGPAQGQGVGPGPQPQQVGLGNLPPPLVPQPGGNLLANAAGLIQGGQGPAVPVNPGPAANVPAPPNLQPPNLLFRQPNLPHLPQPGQGGQNQGPRLPPPPPGPAHQGPHVAAAPQGPLQAGNLSHAITFFDDSSDSDYSAEI